MYIFLNTARCAYRHAMYVGLIVYRHAVYVGLYSYRHAVYVGLHSYRHAVAEIWVRTQACACARAGMHAGRHVCRHVHGRVPRLATAEAERRGAAGATGLDGAFREKKREREKTENVPRP